MEQSRVRLHYSILTGGLRPPDPLTRFRLRAQRYGETSPKPWRRRALAGARCPAPLAWLARSAHSLVSAFHHRLSILPATLLVVTVPTGFAHAQSRDCSIAPRGVGASMGRTSPYLELSQGAVDAVPTGSILVRSSLQFAGRGDLPIVGPWRVRVEAAAANWPVVRQIYGQGFEPVASEHVGLVRVRQLVGMIGRQGGRSLVCGYVLAGGGLYSVGFRGATVRRPGVALTAGMEFPTSERGAIQADLQLHLIDTEGRYPIAGSAVPAAGIMVGWSLRF